MAHCMDYADLIRLYLVIIIFFVLHWWIPWTFGKYGLMKGCWNWQLINSPFSFRIPCPVYQIQSSTTQRYCADNYQKMTAYSSSIWAWLKDPNLPNGMSLILLHTFFARSKSLFNHAPDLEFPQRHVCSCWIFRCHCHRTLNSTQRGVMQTAMRRPALGRAWATPMLFPHG